MLQRHFYKTQESKYKKINEMAQHLNTRQVYHTIFQSVTSDTFYYYVVLSIRKIQGVAVGLSKLILYFSDPLL